MTMRLLTASCWLTLIALALMVWSVLVPKPIPVVLAMSVGQALGTLAFLLYLAVFLMDLRRAGIISWPRRSKKKP